MKRCISRCLGILTVVLAVSCAKETESDFPSGMETGTLVARWAEDPKSRTEIQSDGTTVMWSGEEHIRVFFGPQFSPEMISTQAGNRKEAVFAGKIPNPNWPMTPGPLYQEYWALYPYDESAGCDGESITLRIPSVQPVKAGSFADNFFPAMARTSDISRPMVFYNLCGGACFSVSESGITSVSFKSVGGEALCGRVRVGFNAEGRPELREVIAGIDSVVLAAPSGGFIPGQHYYAAFLPQTLSHGMIETFHKGKMVASTSIDRPIVINRSRFGRLDGLDRGLDYVEDSSFDDPNNIIQFEDNRIRAACIAAFDTNGDRKLSYGEAAAAQSIEGVFDVSRLYTSFDEFRFFTGVTEIPDNCFANCALLKRISLPDSVKRIGESAFSGCNSFERIDFGVGLVEIGYKAFSACTSLKHVDIPSLPHWLDLSIIDAKILHPNSARPEPTYDYTAHPFYASGEGHLYIKGEELTFVRISGYNTIRRRAFYNCKSITGVSFPGGFHLQDASSFYGCSNLNSAEVPSIEDWMKLGTSPFSVFSGGGHIIAGGKEITHLVIPEGTVEIPSRLFQKCFFIQEITLPSSLRRIRDEAFDYCDQLKKANIADMNSWLSIEFTRYRKNQGQGDYVSSSPFVSSGEGHLFIDGEEVTIVSISPNRTDIPVAAFENCKGITDIILPHGSITVLDRAFIGCTNLTRAHIPSTQSWLDLYFVNGSFFFCSHEGHIFLPEGDEIKRFVLPEQTSSIERYAFEYCTGLESITLEPTVPPTLGVDAFLGVTCPIYVWAPCLDAYKNASGWKDYANLLTANPNTP